MSPRRPERVAVDAADPTAHPLWPVVLVLADIARRVAGQSAAKHGGNEDAPEAPPAAGEGVQP